MTPQDQGRFIRELAYNILEEVTGKIEQGKIPAAWDGVELRQYLADKFQDAVFSGTLAGRRKARYQSTVIERNL
jgi:hypothetical protein